MDECFCVVLSYPEVAKPGESSAGEAGAAAKHEDEAEKKESH